MIAALKDAVSGNLDAARRLVCDARDRTGSEPMADCCVSCTRDMANAIALLVDSVERIVGALERDETARVHAYLHDTLPPTAEEP